MYEVLNSHYKRRCHPETCCCETDYVVVEDGFIVADVDTEEEGYNLIQWIKDNPED